MHLRSFFTFTEIWVLSDSDQSHCHKGGNVHLVQSAFPVGILIDIGKHEAVFQKRLKIVAEGVGELYSRIRLLKLLHQCGILKRVVGQGMGYPGFIFTLHDVVYAVIYMLRKTHTLACGMKAAFLYLDR